MSRDHDPMQSHYGAKAPDDGWDARHLDHAARERDDYLRDLIRVGNAIRKGTATDEETLWFEEQSRINAARRIR